MRAGFHENIDGWEQPCSTTSRKDGKLAYRFKIIDDASPDESLEVNTLWAEEMLLHLLGTKGHGQNSNEKKIWFEAWRSRAIRSMKIESVSFQFTSFISPNFARLYESTLKQAVQPIIAWFYRRILSLSELSYQ